MRKSLFSTLLALFFAVNAHAQTTYEEYIYLTKGYKTQLENGLDMKQGYRMVAVPVFVESVRNDTLSSPLNVFQKDIWQVQRTAQFKALYREGDDKPCAMLCLYEKHARNKATNEVQKFVDYICIPHYTSDAKIWDMYNTKISVYANEANFSEASRVLLIGIAKAAAYFAK